MLALYVVAGILLVIVLVLSVPVDLRFDFKTGGDGRAILRAEWLFGLVGKGLLPRKKRVEKPKKPKKPRKRGRSDFRSILTLVRTRGVVPEFIRLVKRMVGSIHIRQLNADIRLGLDDPADTGVMCAVLWPVFIRPVISRTTRWSVEPVFTGPTFEAALQGNVRVFPAEIVANALRFILSPAGLRLIKVMVVSRWKKKK